MKDTQLLQFQAYDYLKDLILKDKLEHGIIHSQKKVAEDMGISKTPMRDAVMRLEQERYIDVYPSKGFKIHEMTPENIKETYQIRSAIESYCLKQLTMNPGTPEAKQCIEELQHNIELQEKAINTEASSQDFARYDYEFHRRIVSYVENEAMMQLYNGFMHRIFWQTVLSFSRQGRMTDTLSEHKRILNAIEEQDWKNLERLFENHLSVAEKINLELPPAARSQPL